MGRIRGTSANKKMGIKQGLLKWRYPMNTDSLFTRTCVYIYIHICVYDHAVIESGGRESVLNIAQKMV